MRVELEQYQFKTGKGRFPHITQLFVSDHCRVPRSKRKSRKRKTGITSKRMWENPEKCDKELVFPKMDFERLNEYAMYYVCSTQTVNIDRFSGRRQQYKRYHVIVRRGESFYTVEYHNFVRNEKLAFEMLNNVNDGNITGYEALSLMFL